MSHKLSTCEKVRRAGDLKSRDGNSTEKGGRQEIKVLEAGDEGMGGGRAGDGRRKVLTPPVPPRQFDL